MSNFKILIDNNLPKKLLFSEIEFFHCSEFGFERSSDIEIFEYCKYNSFAAILTKDKDFEHLVLIHKIPPKIIQLTCGNITKDDLVLYLSKFNESINDFLNNSDGAILVI